ncbi:histidine--tRNA ligase [Candidatus Uhrbacteria bacterium]|nr:histidine--tRNA ligase [Candidatus Uhrbacteria bacterium]
MMKKTVVSKLPVQVEPLKKVSSFQLVRGMKDVLPSEHRFWSHVLGKSEEIAKAYGFSLIETPVLEETGLFVRSIGKQTDIVEKEMFSFVDQGGENLSLRPEFTAGVVRAYIEHGMLNQPQPVKMYSHGPVFRHERPQTGRYRQFHQFNFELIGEAHPVADAELIIVANVIFKELGMKINVHINSVGDAACRPKYREVLVNYYRTKRKNLCEDCQMRLVKNPLRLLDCKNPQCQPFKAEAPQLVDWLCDDCKNHFMRVLEYLDEAEVIYNLNPHIVRGLDYYTRTAFEIFLEDEETGSQSAIASGGRYDSLIEQMGGRPTPAVGWAMGVERVINKIKEKNLPIPEPPRLEVFLAQLGDQAKKKSLVLFENLRREGFRVAQCFSKDNLKAQLEVANKTGAKLALVLGQKEMIDGTIMIRDMEAGVQEVVDFNKIVLELKKRLRP